jgi:Flp pilus assembly protein TadD
MPPWKPEQGHGEFVGSRRLADEEIAQIQNWVEAGCPEGDQEDRSTPSEWASTWNLGAPDIQVMMPEPYVLEPDGSDVFRTFVVRVPLQTRRYVRALHFQSGNSRAVHHANLKIDQTRSSRSLDENDSAPGYEGAGGLGAKFPDGHFLGWTPGQTPRIASDELSWRLEPGSDLVIEVHMVPTGKRELIQPSVSFYFAEGQPLKLPYMLRLGRQDIDIPAGERAYASTDSYVLPVDVEVLAVQPHAHLLAKEIRGLVMLPDGRVEWLIFIKNWDINWQDTYRLARPMLIPRGSTLSMSYIYDNSTANVRNPNNPPLRVTYGQTTSSEMGDLWIQVMPRTHEDRDALHRDFAPKMLRADIAGVEKMLQLDPGDPRIHADLGFCYLEAGRVTEAIVHLKRAALLEPLSAGRQYDLGMVFFRTRDFSAARAHFTEAVRLKPDFSEAYNNLGVLSYEEGRIAEAIGWYSRALLINPDDAEAAYNLGRAFATGGDTESATVQFRLALRLKPNDAVTHSSLANVLASQGQLGTAVRHYRYALEIEANLAAALVDLAWILATSDHDDVRAPAEAVRLAERAATLTGYANIAVLDTLAASYAANGERSRAIAAAEKALSLAIEPAAVAAIGTRLESYRRSHAEQRR